MREICSGNGRPWPGEPPTPDRTYDLFQLVRLNSGRSGCYVHIGWGFIAGIGSSSGKLRISPSGSVAFDTADSFPTGEECWAAREYLAEKYPSHFKDSTYDGFDVDAQYVFNRRQGPVARSGGGARCFFNYCAKKVYEGLA